MADRSRFGRLLRNTRVAHGLTQEELAARARLSPRAVSDLERGLKLAPRWSTVRLLIAALELTSSDAADFVAAARSTAADAAPPANNLPADVSTFIGREWELAELPSQLSTARLLTLTGPGGVGKTRLALRLATRVQPRYPDGVWLIDLAPLSDHGLLAQSFAAALGVRDTGHRSMLDAVRDRIASQTLLLVVDNCEHLAAPCAEFVERLLRACPHLRVLATSREPLGIAGETVWRVATLRLPTGPATVEELSAYEAVQLFVERARATLPSFRLTAPNAVAVARICRRLDGLPLAIELAAARVNLLSVEQLAARLAASFQLLVAGRRTAPSRHQTLRATLDWSYELLVEQEQLLLERLSVFAGGCSLEGAEAVCVGDTTIERMDVLNWLGRLVDKSMVLAEPDVEGGIRYRLHETLREYGVERLAARGQLDRTRRAHAEFYLDLARQASGPLVGQGQAEWLVRLQREHDNLRAALGWTLEGGDIETGLGLGANLWRFWWYRGHIAEGERWLSRLLQHPRPGSRAWRQVLFGAGRAALHRGDLALARVRFESLRALATEEGDQRMQASALSQLSQIARDEGDPGTSHELILQALAIHRQIGFTWGASNDLETLSLLALQNRDYATARRLGEEALALVRDLGDATRVAFVLASVGQVDLEEGNLATARARFGESLTLFRELANPVGLARALYCFARLAFAEGQPERAYRLLGASAAQREALGYEFT